jgi:hypothetical protein
MNRMLISTGGLAIAGAVLLLASVNTDYDKSADFGKYRTYSWIGVKAGNDIWVGRIQDAVNQSLTAKGWTMTPSGGDAGVSAFGATKEIQTLNTFYDGLGGGWGWRRGWGGGIGQATTTVDETPVGTLVVDIFDGSTKKLIWRGKSSETLSSNADKNDKKMEKDVAEMFKKFPPNAKGE